MRLEHINLVVTDLDQTLAFYQMVFPEWRVRIKEEGDWYGKPRTWVHFGDDITYLAFSDNGVGVGRDLKGHSVGLAHFAFEVKNITALKKRMADAGVPIKQKGADNPFRENVYYLDPDGYELEFVEYKSDLISERNNTL